MNRIMTTPCTQQARLQKGGGHWKTAFLGMLVVLVLVACSGGEPEWVVLDNSEDPWVRVENHCVRESTEGAMRRVINRTDPELCGRMVKNRPSDYVRIGPPQ